MIIPRDKAVQATSLRAQVDADMVLVIQLLKSDQEIKPGQLNSLDQKGVTKHGRAAWAARLEENLEYSQLEQHW
ncbi:MAG: hypothetical protein A3B68_00570 [Candidatus Melainabacteria bacterium RIFCSPHIGHO2_02_FULL_34_12]|nr:MAG: hypothetical protein A3B68_00570 [Candidatus Melainabacteria bacterium RIFCSPHIGHO2_02_FULL_34_12]